MNIANDHERSPLIALWRYLEARRKVQVAGLLLLMVLGTLAEMASLGALLPFIGVLIDPAKLFSQPFVAGFAETIGVSTPQGMVLPLTMLFVAVVIGAGAMRVFLIWATNRFAFGVGSDIGGDVYRRALYQPFDFHAAHNSGELIAVITTKVWSAINVMQAMLLMVTSGILVIGITATLLMINAYVAIIAAVCFGTAYLIVARVSRRRLAKNSQQVAHYVGRLVKALQEGFGGIRDVLLDGTQSAYDGIFRGVDRPLRNAQASNAIISSSPRYIIEALGTAMIAVLAYTLSRSQSNGIAGILPVLGALALGAQRLLPALQQGYASWAQYSGNRATVADVVEMLERTIPDYQLQPAPPPLEFVDEIQCEHVGFRYTEAGPWVLRDLDLVIPKGMRYGFVGTSGSGKSTSMDLLMGLLVPSEGRILVDGKEIVGRYCRSWQRIIAHVPQSIFLSDASFAQNIAFGVPGDAIDMARVKRAAEMAHIADFIEGDGGGYDALVGERGIRLSGGQRQRIGIARALYKEATVLVFDEATSALDNATEKSLMAAIGELSRELTVLIIAHRLSTVRDCDQIVMLEDGRVAGQGTYTDLIETNSTFRKLAQ